MLTLVQPAVEEYSRAKSQPEGALLEELVRVTFETMEIPEMLCGQLEGRFLKLMVQSIRARRVLEIGMFTGYSALSMAEGLPDDGELITCDIDPKAITTAKKFFARSEHGKKITVKEGQALETIKQLKGHFDLVFIDADKDNYPNYYEAVLPLMTSGGVILVDNVLRGGAVVNPQTDMEIAIDKFNQHVVQDERVEAVMLPIRDGIYFIRKK